MIRKTVFSVSTDETRYVLNGVNFLMENGKITLIATDGRRLAFIQRELPDKKSLWAPLSPQKPSTN
jgi:DNA polymerase-3 subunit beta